MIDNFKDEGEIAKEIKRFKKDESKYRSKTYCFCQDKLFSSLSFDDTQNYKIGNDKPCETFVVDWLLLNGLSIGIAIIIPALNSFMLIVLTKVTVFERNKTLSEDMKSVMFKIFMASFINTVILI